MKFVLMIFALLPLFGGLRAEEVKDTHFIDENAFKTLLGLAQQTKPTSQVAPAVKTEYPYLSQNERLTLQGERQTKYPLQPLNVEYALLPEQPITTQSHPPTEGTKVPLDGVKPLYIAYPPNSLPSLTLAGLQAFTQQSKPSSGVTGTETTDKTKPAAPALLLTSTYSKPATPQVDKVAAENKAPVVENKQPAYPSIQYPNLFTLINQVPNNLAAQQTLPDPYQLYAGANSPSFIIINPTSYPSFHYYPTANYSFPRIAAADSLAPAVEVPDFVKELQFAQPSSTSGSPVEILPILAPATNTLTNEESIFSQALLKQSRQTETQNALLELLKNDQQKRRLQEQVAAFFFRNYNLNKK